jgi:hypothetical protein
MKIYKSLLIIFLAFFVTGVGFGQEYQKQAQAGFQFLLMSNDARITALGEAGASLEANASSILYNPAGMARLTNFTDVTFGKTSWIADINYLHGAVAINPLSGEYGVFGLSFVYVDYGTFFRTIRATNEQGYLDMGTFKPFAMSLGFSYAKALSDKFSVGGTIHYNKQDLGKDQVISEADDGTYGTKDYSLSTLSYDFGVIYKTGLKSLTLGLNVRNFSQEIKYEKDGFQLPLIFKIGLSMNALELFPSIDQEMHKFLISVDASHPRDYPEQVGIGGEYLFMKTIALRLGYLFPSDESGISAGVGLQQDFDGYNFGLDYAYTSFGVFKDVHKFTLRFSL